MAGKKGERREEMSWISKKLFLYNVTIGLYAMDWWERYLFNTVALILLWFVCFNTYRSVCQAFDSHLKTRIFGGGNMTMGVAMPFRTT